MRSGAIPHPHESPLLRDVRRGFARPQRELPPKYFYDHRGSLLFEEITRLPEYYLTRAERRLLTGRMPALARALSPTALVELGAGSGEKTRSILEAMRAAGSGRAYVPVDVSAEFLSQSAERLRGEMPWLAIEPLVADFAERLPEIPRDDGPTLFAFLGSTIGNFEPAAALHVLRQVRGAMRVHDRLLLGADLHTKPVERIERAYNDAAGVTAAFNRNMLHVLNRELGAGFDPLAFSHRASWSWAYRRIEMHLVARKPMQVPVPGLGTLRLREHETIRTEICCKYDRDQLDGMLTAAGMTIEHWWVDAADQYALLIGRPLVGGGDARA